MSGRTIMIPDDHPSRRDILSGRLAVPVPEAHISSLVVHIRHGNFEAARDAVASLAGVEIHAAGAGKLVVTVETDSESDVVARMNDISLIEGVMSTALVYHHFEPAPENGPGANQD